MPRVRLPSSLTLACVLSIACADSGSDPAAAERASAAVASSALPVTPAPAAPVPTPILPVPTLAAVFVGDAASRLLASGLGRPAPPAPPPSLAAAAASSPAPSSSGAAGAERVLDAGPPKPRARALVAAAAISREPYERPDDETWSLPDSPAEIIWRHPAPAAGLQVELLEAKGRSWPTRVRVEPAGAFRVATVTPLEALPPGKDFRLVARVLAADGRSLLWTEPLQVRRPEPPAETAP